MRRLHLCVVILLALSPAEGLSVWIARGDAQTTKTALTLALEAELDRFPARTSIYVKHLTTGEEAAVRAGESFNSQSVIKVPIHALKRTATQRCSRRIGKTPQSGTGGPAGRALWLGTQFPDA